MSGISRVGDIAGGTIIGNLAPTVFVNGLSIAVNNCEVSPHGDGTHASAKMIADCNNVYANGLLVVKSGNQATCGHTSNGSDNVSVG